MDIEIGYAARAGLDYWAYCWYGETDSAMQHAWHLHQTSSKKDCVHWSMILQFSRLGNREKFESCFSNYIAYFKQANYQKVLSKRPLLFIYVDNQMALSSSWGGDWRNVGGVLKSLRESCEAADVAAPYTVIMFWDPVVARDIMLRTSSDAISNYIGAVARGRPATYEENDRTVQAYWRRMVSTGAPVVPICQTGWDDRPRKEHPPPWEHHSGPADTEDFVAAGTPEQIASHVKKALMFVDEHVNACPSRVVLIYSWNESDEGGSALIPYYGSAKPNTSVLDAVSVVLRAR